jgi:hypothetical protein
MRRILMIAAVGSMLLAFGAQPAEAQLRRARDRAGFGLYGALARPVGEFQNSVEWGGGGGFYGLYTFDRRGHVGLRMEGTFLIYGHERYAVPFWPYVARVLLDVSTDNLILGLGAGPQITLGSGGFRPYAFGTVGFSYFATVSSLSGSDGSDAFASTTNFDDVTLALNWGGGILMRIARGRRSVWLDLSAQSTYNGEAEYLKRGGIVEYADGRVVLDRIVSDANLLTFRVGIAIGL